MRSTILQLVLVAVLNAAGQLSLKIGSDALTSLGDLFTNPLGLLGHPYFLVGGVLYASSFTLYVNALSRTRLSLAYPFMGLTYVLVVVLSVTVLGESVGPRTIFGTLLVFVGITLIGLGGSA